MAEANFNEFVAGGASGRARTGSTLNMIGAVTSLALLAGAGVWAYKLAVRDASGVPVIMAMEGPVRVAPEEPGGRVMANTGLTVMQIAGSGQTGELPDQIRLAPAPVDLAEDDAPGIGSAAPREVVESDSFARTLALAEELARQAAAEMSPDDSSGAPAPDALALAVADAVAEAGGMRTSLRPMPRPRSQLADAAQAAQSPGLAISGAVALSSAAPLGSVEEVDPTALPSGARLAQIGAFETMELARAEWARVAARHGALFEGKSRVIQPASSVGRTFYRLRVAGFGSEDDSRRFCAAIEAGDLRCVPVTQR